MVSSHGKYYKLLAKLHVSNIPKNYGFLTPFAVTNLCLRTTDIRQKFVRGSQLMFTLTLILHLCARSKAAQGHHKSVMIPGGRPVCRNWCGDQTLIFPMHLWLWRLVTLGPGVWLGLTLIDWWKTNEKHSFKNIFLCPILFSKDWSIISQQCRDSHFIHLGQSRYLTFHI